MLEISVEFDDNFSADFVADFVVGQCERRDGAVPPKGAGQGFGLPAPDEE